MKLAHTALMLAVALRVGSDRADARKLAPRKGRRGGHATLFSLQGPSETSTWRAPETWNVETTTIVFVKMTKVGGSTVGGVVRRIAAHHGLAGVADGMYTGWAKNGCRTPGVWANHIHGAKVVPAVQSCRQQGRNVFLLGWVRGPLERCLSKFYHLRVSRANEPPTVANKLKACGTHSNAHASADFQAFVAPHDGASPEESLEAYNFIGLTQRFDESMVVLQDILGLSTTDILYMTSKNSSAGQMGKKDAGRHTTIVAHPSLEKEEPAIQSLVTDSEWISQNHWSLKINELAGKRIDEHIRDIGEAEFARRLDRYTRMEATARASCGHATPATGGADPDAAQSDKAECYWNDNGCHYRCLDRVAEEFSDE